MTTNPTANISPPALPSAAKTTKPRTSPLEFFSGCIVTAIMLHLVWGMVGGNFVVPWFSDIFWPEGTITKVGKKESVEVEVVENILTEPPPPAELPPPPPDAPPPPPPPPDAMQTPPEPVAPMLAVPAEMPETKPLPPPKLLAVAPPTTKPMTNPPAATAPPAAAIPGPKGTGRIVDRGLYQRSEAEYPYEARKRRIQGTVYLEAVFTADGRVVSVEVVESSGNSILDRAAVAHGLANFYSRSGQAERVKIPIEFRLVSQ